VRIGSGADAVVARWVKQTERCRTLNVEQDDLPYSSRGLKVLAGRDMSLGVYLEVLTGGRVRVGDPVAVSA
jgi:MOSC domain-containing protein YiiM